MLTRLTCWLLGHMWINEEDGLPDKRNGVPIGDVRCCRCPEKQADWRLWV